MRVASYTSKRVVVVSARRKIESCRRRFQTRQLDLLASSVNTYVYDAPFLEFLASFLHGRSILSRQRPNQMQAMALPEIRKAQDFGSKFAMARNNGMLLDGVSR